MCDVDDIVRQKSSGFSIYMPLFRASAAVVVLMPNRWTITSYKLSKNVLIFIKVRKSLRHANIRMLLLLSQIYFHTIRYRSLSALWFTLCQCHCLFLYISLSLVLVCCRQKYPSIHIRTLCLSRMTHLARSWPSIKTNSSQFHSI